MDLSHIVILASSALPPITMTSVVAYFTWFWVIVGCICLAGESVASTERRREREPDFAPMPEAEPCE